MFCIQCGKEISGESKYCQECGALQKTETIVACEKRHSKKRLWYILIPIFILLCVGIGLVSFYFINNRKGAGILGEWTVESLSGVAIKDVAKERGVGIEEVSVNVSIQEDKILFSTLSGNTALDMELAYEKKEDTVFEAYPVDTYEVRSDDESTMIFRYDLSTDKITITPKVSTETNNNSTTIVLVRGTMEFPNKSSSIDQPYNEKDKEVKDSQLLWTIESAFVSAIANLGIDEYDSTELTDEIAREMEILLGKSIENIQEEFVSEVCKGQDLYFYANPVTQEIRVSIGNREGLYGKASEEVFCAGNAVNTY